MSKFYKHSEKLESEVKAETKRLFNNARLDLLKFDELNTVNVTENVNQLFSTLEKKARGYFEEVKEGVEEDTDKTLGLSINKFLDSYDTLLLFVFSNEVLRKASRYTETLLARIGVGKSSPNSLIGAKSFDDMKRNINLWNNQVIEALAEFERELRIQAMKEDGVKYVQWKAQIGCCDTCDELNGQIFPIDNVPDLPHIHCRCEVDPFDIDRKGNDDKIDVALEIVKTLSASGKNYDVYNPFTGEYTTFVEGTRIEQLKNDRIIAGKGSKNPIRDIDDIMDFYQKFDKYEWSKQKGFGYVYDEYGEPRRAEIHWYQYGEEQYEHKIKPQSKDRIYLDD